VVETASNESEAIRNIMLSSTKQGSVALTIPELDENLTKISF
jgi:hypothetical protein